MPPKRAREQVEREGVEQFYQVIRYGEHEYCRSEPMPETVARHIAKLEEQTDPGIHAGIVPARRGHR